MVGETSGIILDGQYVEGFLAAALSDGYVTFRHESEAEKQLVDSYASRIRRSRFKRKSLELALLFHNVYLHDPFELAMLERLHKEGMVNSWKLYPYKDTPLQRGESSDLSVAAFLKPLLLKHLAQLFKRMRPSLKKMRGLTQKYIVDLYDFTVLWSAGLHQEAIAGTNFPIMKILEIKEDPVAYIRELFSIGSLTGTMHGFIADVIAMDFEISSLISLTDMSKEKRIPFATKRIISYKEKHEVEAAHSAYTLCLLPFQDEVRYAPVVDSVEDLLRLREKEEIDRFREVLNAWGAALLNGEVDLAERIRVDISKANEEIKKLNKWRQVDRWFYYLALPTAFVPYVSNLVTIGSVWTRRHIEATERTYGWIAIAR